MNAYRTELRIPNNNILQIVATGFQAGEEVEVIILSKESPEHKPKSEKHLIRHAGFAKRTFIMSDDFDAPLDELKEYVE
jgi:hypothetical protein